MYLLMCGKISLCFVCCGLFHALSTVESSGVDSDRCDLTWRDKLQAQADMLQPLLDQFLGLTLLDALFRSSRQAKIVKITVSITHMASSSRVLTRCQSKELPFAHLRLLQCMFASSVSVRVSLL